MFAVPIFFALLTFAYLVFALYVSFDTEGGSIGMVPVFLHALGVPMAGLLCVFSLEAVFLMDARSAQPSLPEWPVPGWAYAVGFVAAVVAVGSLIHVSGWLGARFHRRASRQ